MSGRSVSSIDLYIANRIRERRILIGMSQGRLGDELGITFQQIQKYESGANRVSAGRLYEIAQVLGVPVTHFFEGLDSVSLAAPDEPRE